MNVAALQTMNDKDKSKEQLIEELNDLRERLPTGERMIEGSHQSGFNRLLDNLKGILVYRHNAEGNFTYISPSITAVLGYAPEEFLTHFSNYLTGHPCNDEVRKKTALTLQGIRQPPYEIQIFHKDGSIYWLEVSEIPVRDKDDNITAVEGIAYDITERKQAEEQLLFTKFSVDTAADAIEWIGTDAKILYVNESACKQLGYSREEILSMHVWDFDPLFPQERWPGFWKELQQKGSMTFETQHRTKDGTRFPVEITANTLEYEGTEYIFTQVKDITERKKAEDKLRQSEKKFEVLFNQSIQFTGLLATDGTMLAANQTALNFVDQDESALIGKLFWETPWWIHSKQEQERLREAIRKGAGGEWSRYEATHIFPDGTLHYFDFSLKPILDDSGNPSMLIVEGRDMTDSRQAEELLRESELRYRSLIENAPIVAWITDRQGKTSYISPNVKKIYGYTSEEILAAGEELWFDRIHPDDREAVQQAFETLFSEHVHHDMEYRIQRKDGEWIWLHDRANVIVERDGQEQAYGVFSDVTETKRQEEKLQQSARMQVVGQLAGGIAHDFNNQLAGVIGYAGVLRGKVSDKPQLARYVDNILIASGRAADLTRQLLAFARKGNYLTVPVDIHKIIGEVVSLLQHSINRNIHVVQQLNAEFSLTMGDPTQLQNALLNLALNARDAMPDGGELIFATDTTEIDKEYRESKPSEIQAGSYLHICVTDSGTGIDEQTQQHMYEPFYTTKEEGKGTGMGLAAVYGTVKAHGGYIHVDSELGRGTTMEMHLPLATGATEFQDDADGMRATPIKGTGCILIVDDEEMVLDSLSHAVCSLGYTVHDCSSGAEAMELYQKEWESIDLVILDVVMPKMGGRDTFLAMRQINPNVVVLLSSGHSRNGEAQATLEEGARGFIQKPCGIAELSQVIADILRAK
jgi:PAS domain S-box-containing protein